MAVSHLQDHLGFWLRSVSNHVSHAFAQKLEDSDVTVAEWVILCEMFERSGITPSELAQIVGLTRGAVSKLSERLVQKKLLDRTYAEDDRRYQTLALTPAGTQLVPKLAALADSNDEEFFGILSSKAQARLLKSLKKLAAAHNLTHHPID